MVTLLPEVVSAAPVFVSQTRNGATTKTLKLKIKKPKVAKSQSLDMLQMKACWVREPIKALSVTTADKKKLKFTLNKKNGTFDLKKLTSVKFPLDVVVSFKTARPVIPRGSEVLATSTVHCTKTKKRPVCPASVPVIQRNPFDGVTCVQPFDFEENISPAIAVTADGDALDLHPLTSPIRVGLQGAKFGSDLTDATVTVNDQPFLGTEIKFDGGLLSVSAALKDGLNSITVDALDSQGRQIEGHFKLWGGSNTLTVNVVDEAGKPVNGAEVTCKIADDKNVFIKKTSVNGVATFENLPSATVAISADAPGGLHGFIASSGNQVSETITLVKFQSASTVDNNSIKLGVQGWNVGSAPVTVAQHLETLASPRRGQPEAETEADQDLILTTLGQGLQFITRTFTVKPGTKSVSVRYRFQTSEFPGGYFGSRFNDYFNISIRALTGGGSTSSNDDGNNMNAMGRGAFTAAGYTAWRTATLPITSPSDVVQVQVAVANVADGAYDSSVIVDKIEEEPFTIKRAELLDIDGSALKLISGDTHTYFEGFTRIHGTIRLEGEKDDSLKSLNLQFLEGDTVKTTAKIASTGGDLLKGKFGKEGFKEIATSTLLFKIFPKDTIALASEENKTYTMRIKATSTKGHSAEFDAGTVELLVRFRGQNRYPAPAENQRDQDLGGDDWALPTIRSFANDMTGLTYGDFSNMNGGRFNPHQEHQGGTDIDAWFEGYNSLDGTVADRIIDILNTPTLGSRIQRVLVRFSRRPNDPFWAGIRGRVLNNGRSADRMIFPHADHGTHFHMDVSR